MNRTTFQIATSEKYCIVNITHKIEAWLRQISAKDAVLLITVPHATAGLILNEDESGLHKDIINLLKISENANYPTNTFHHNRTDDNASAHLGSMIIGTQIILPVTGGNLQRGTWQELLFVELDGPKPERHINLTIIN